MSKMVVCTDTGGVVRGLRRFRYEPVGDRGHQRGGHVAWSGRGKAAQPDAPGKEVTIPSGTTLRLDLQSAVLVGRESG